ncbi:hypothetical protein AB6A40_001585 [Gnathostoma spinigerum]|uniref:Uncharacterized protein n=1 Tax=Gnathostoma spinigerum TaxID=75299 RepID=A0ABD6EBU8_9BILA
MFRCTDSELLTTCDNTNSTVSDDEVPTVYSGYITNGRSSGRGHNGEVQSQRKRNAQLRSVSVSKEACVTSEITTDIDGSSLLGVELEEPGVKFSRNELQNDSDRSGFAVDSDQRANTSRAVAPPHVLRTLSSLKGNPRMYVTYGRPRGVRRIPAEDSPPPNLRADGVSGQATTMSPLFRLYSRSAVRQANLSLSSLTENEISANRTESDPLSCESSGILEEVVDDAGHRVTSFPDSMKKGRRQWPLYSNRAINFQEACDILTQRMPVNVSKICASVPQQYRGTGTFVIDLRDLANRHDVSLDGLGMWGKPTGRARYFAFSEHNRLVRIDDGAGKIPMGSEYEYKCMCKRYEHPQTVGHESKFIKKIFTALHPPARQTAVAVAVVTYEWIGEPFEFSVIGKAPSSRNSCQPPLDGSRSWEAASFNVAHWDPSEDGNAFFDGCPVFEVGAVDFSTAAAIILGSTQIDVSRICTRVPQGYRLGGTFVIDIQNFITDAELRRDANGAWGKPAGYSRYYRFVSNGEPVRVDSGQKLADGVDYDVQILSKRYEHTAVNGRFVRKIYTGRTKSGDRLMHFSNLAVITYYWKGEPEEFIATPQRRVRIGKDCQFSRGLSVKQFPQLDPEDAVICNEFDDVEDDAVQHSSPPSLISGHSPSKLDSQQNQTSQRPVFMRRPALMRTNVNDDIDSLRAETARREYENQERFSSLLDRASALLDRFERMNDVLSQAWLSTQREDPSAQIVIGENTIDEDVQYVQDDNYSLNVLSDQSSFSSNK